MEDDGFVTTEAPVDSGFDASVEDAATETTDTSTETGLETPAAEVSEKIDPAAPAVDGRPVIDGRLNPSFKPVLEKLKAEAPAVAKAIQNALFFEDRLRRELPGGLKEVQALRAHVEQLGGEDGIKEITGELDGWRKFDDEYTAGDPKVLEFLTSEPQAKDAFLKIAPAAFEKFRELNPEGYGAYVSQVFLADLHQEKIPLLIERLGDLLPTDNPKAQELWQALAGYINRIGKLASKSVAPPAVSKAPQDDARIKELETRETALRRTEWRGGTNKTHTSLYGQEWKKQIGERKLTGEQRATVTELYGLKLAAILKGTPKFNENLQRYFAAGRKEEFQKYVDSIYKEAVPKALRAAVSQAGLGAKSPNPAVVKPSPLSPPIKPSTGFQLVNAKPKMDTVDRVQTSTDMFVKGQAVLKTGQKIQWRV